MSFDYISARAVADSLIAEFGAPVTLSTQSGPAFDPVTGAPITPSAGASITGAGAKLNYKAAEIDGSVIQMGDCKLMLSTRQTPLIGMTTTLGGELWRVVQANKLQPDSNTIVLWSLQMRR
jgi:hypothetical protein